MGHFSVAMANEAELISQAQRGDRNAFGELVCLHTPGVRNVIYRMCADSQIAEDAAQETFIQAWLHLSSYRPQTSLRNWLYRIAFNAATDILRREQRILPNAIEDLALRDLQPNPETQLFQSERVAVIQKAILSLPDSSRAVLILREYEEMSYHEIADTLDIPVGTVMSRLNYARKMLKERLKASSLLQMEADYVEAC